MMSSPMFHKALVPINSSDLSQRVVRMAVDCVKNGTVERIVLLSVWEADEVDYTKFRSADKEQELKTRAKEALKRYDNYLREQGIETEAILDGGDPSEIIMKTVVKGGYDLIIMGSRRLNKVQELVFGSVSDRVTRLSSVPVLIVK